MAKKLFQLSVQAKMFLVLVVGLLGFMAYFVVNSVILNAVLMTRMFLGSRMAQYRTRVLQ